MAQVTLTCKLCNSQFTAAYKYRAKRQFCSRACTVKFQTGSGNPAYGKTYRTKETHPEWAVSISTTSSERRINSGDKNGMKRPEVAQRMSQTRREKVTSDPTYRKHLSENRRQAWASGKYDGVAVGRCKWYDHVKPDGSTAKLQGTWEVALARRLDELNVDYHAHKGRWSYMLDGVERSYYPDFYVPMWDMHVDVKGVFWDECGAEKFSAVRESNPEQTLVIADRETLESWGVDVLSVQKELLEESN